MIGESATVHITVTTVHITVTAVHITVTTVHTAATATAVENQHAVDC
jgi:hypothetical protein